MKRIENCRVCNNRYIQEFLDLGNQPFANSLLNKLDSEESYYPLSLSWCPECNLVQLNHTADPEELFSDYVWVSATSKTAREYSEQFYKEIINRVRPLDGGYVLEAASNDGTFLKPFLNNEHKVLGVDPAQNIVEIAKEDGIPTICSFFGVETSNDIIAKEGKARVVIARNVLPHVANLHDFVEGLNICLEEEGLLVLEVHYAKIILEELHYDSIYHEHLCYFTFKSLERLLNQHGLFIVDLNQSPISGGSIVVYVKKKKEGETQIINEIRKIEEVEKINEFSSWQHFANLVQDHKTRLITILFDLNEAEGSIVGYGASARSSTLLNYCGIDSKHLIAIADQNPLKQGKFTAGTHIKIESPDKVFENSPSSVFIIAWNFADEIIDILQNKFSFKGTIVIPLPNEPRVVEL
ncbi:MAG: class I SAM-dependent methyltransferase [Candidatus Hodarchaeales archaeon]|jgi:SAM-dependent methyltransferase